MEGPLDGVRVLEVANYLAVPSAAALMADMGADVIKIEPPGGEVSRPLTRNREFDYDFPTNYLFELNNRGKRSVVLNLKQQKSLEAVWRLAERADVFMTNLLPWRMERYRLRYEDLSPRNPGLVYLAFSGYGPEGAEKDRPGFDHTAFWARSGIMSLFSEPGKPPVDLQIGMGDHSSSPLILAGVLAALLAGERSGQGQKVTTSLLNMGLWIIAADVQDALIARRGPRHYQRTETPYPIYNNYETGDGRWFTLCMDDTDAHWSKVCKAIGREDLSTNPRYGTPEDRSKHSKELVADLDRVFAATTMEDLAPRLNANSVIWGPMQSLLEALDDPQARANGCFTALEHPEHGPYETLDTPIKFSSSEVGARAPAPKAGQHSEEVLLELGYSPQEIVDMNEG